MAIPDHIKSDAAKAAADQSVLANGASLADHDDGDLAMLFCILMPRTRIKG